MQAAWIGATELTKSMLIHILVRALFLLFFHLLRRSYLSQSLATASHQSGTINRIPLAIPRADTWTLVSTALEPCCQWRRNCFTIYLSSGTGSFIDLSWLWALQHSHDIFFLVSLSAKWPQRERACIWPKSSEFICGIMCPEEEWLLPVVVLATSFHPGNTMYIGATLLPHAAIWFILVCFLFCIPGRNGYKSEHCKYTG